MPLPIHAHHRQQLLHRNSSLVKYPAMMLASIYYWKGRASPN
jgi:hypothetical protein